MPNTCTICRHEKREEIEDALVRGQSSRLIASQFGAGYKAIQRHQTCIAAELKALKASRVEKLNETLIERLERYRGVAEQFLQNDEKALAALDRCYKQVDIEAKLTGAYQEKRENENDQYKQREYLVAALMILAEKDGQVLTREAAIYQIDSDLSRISSVMREAKERAKAEGWVM